MQNWYLFFSFNDKGNFKHVDLKAGPQLLFSYEDSFSVLWLSISCLDKCWHVSFWALHNHRKKWSACNICKIDFGKPMVPSEKDELVKLGTQNATESVSIQAIMIFENVRPLHFSTISILPHDPTGILPVKHLVACIKNR